MRTLLRMACDSTQSNRKGMVAAYSLLPLNICTFVKQLNLGIPISETEVNHTFAALRPKSSQTVLVS